MSVLVGWLFIFGFMVHIIRLQPITENISLEQTKQQPSALEEESYQPQQCVVVMFPLCVNTSPNSPWFSDKLQYIRWLTLTLWPVHQLVTNKPQIQTHIWCFQRLNMCPSLSTGRPILLLSLSVVMLIIVSEGRVFVYFWSLLCCDSSVSSAKSLFIKVVMNLSDLNATQQLSLGTETTVDCNRAGVCWHIAADYIREFVLATWRNLKHNLKIFMVN